MAAVSRQEQPVPGREFAVSALAVDAHVSRSRDKQHELIVGLVVPHPFGRCLAGRDDPLDAQPRRLDKAIEEFLG